MKFYKCTVEYWAGDWTPRERTYFVQADDPVAAFVKVKQETKNLHMVSDPQIEIWKFPSVDFVCHKNDILNQYGVEAFEEAKKKLSSFKDE